MHPETESVGNESSGFNLGHVESEILDSENLIKFLRIIEFGKLLSDRLLQLAFHGSALYSVPHLAFSGYCLRVRL